jgi:hypothetical protein
MAERARLFLRVEATEPEHHMRVRQSLGEQMRAADGAEAAELSRRGFEARKKFLARHSAESFARYRRDARECRAMRAPACLAMAMDDGPERGIRFVADAPAQAMTSEHVNLRKRSNVARRNTNKPVGSSKAFRAAD